MTRLLIVDDEPLVRVGLESMLDWNSLGIDMVDTATNGSQALDIIRSVLPAIVITDIRMPMMTGLELMKACREEMLEPPRFIVLTSYEEISYLREAIRLNAVDYLIKLELTPENLTECIKRVLERPGGGPVNGARGPDAADKAILREVFFIRLINRVFSSDEEIRLTMKRVGADLPGRWFGAAVFRVGIPETVVKSDERNNLLFCAMRMMSDISGPGLHLEMLHLDAETFVAVAGVSCSDEEAESARNQLIDRLRGRLPQTEKYFNLSICAGVGTLSRRFVSIPDSYSEARQSLDFSPLESGLRVFDPAECNSAGSRDWLSFRDDIHSAVVSRSAADMETVLDSVLSTMVGKDARFSSSLDICCSVVYQILSATDAGEALLDDAFPDESEGYRCLYQARSTSETIQWLKRLKNGLAREFRAVGLGYSESVASRIRTYLDEHFLEKIELKKIAEEFGMSPNYISTMFKKHAGMGIIAYQNERRIEYAKDIMISGKWKMYEISDMAGFESPYYFSKVFKRVAGTSPREWLNRQSRGEYQ